MRRADLETDLSLTVGGAAPGLRDGIDIVFFDGGGAHRSAAHSLRAGLLAADPTRDVRVLNTTEFFPLAPVLGTTCAGGIGVYNMSLKQERMWFGSLPWAMGRGVWFADLIHEISVPRLRAFWRRSAPRVLVSVVPIYNRLMLESLRLERPSARCVIVACDFEEICRNYWFHPLVDADYLCGTDRLVQDARAAGVRDERIHQTPGMLTHPKFHAPDTRSAAAERQRCGLKPDLPTVLVFFGGQGSRVMVDVARRLDAGPRPLNLVVICGRHQRAFEELSAWRSKNPKHVVAFSDDVAGFMRMADVMVGKPGPITIFEALACRLPMVLWENPAFGLLFEYNLRWVEEAGVGLRVRSLDEVPAAVERVVSTPSFRLRTAGFGRSATAEAVQLVGKLLHDPSPPEATRETA